MEQDELCALVKAVKFAEPHADKERVIARYSSQSEFSAAHRVHFYGPCGDSGVRGNHSTACKARSRTGAARCDQEGARQPSRSLEGPACWQAGTAAYVGLFAQSRATR